MTVQSSLIDEISDMLMGCGMFNNFFTAELQSAAHYFSTSHIKQGDVIFKDGDAGAFMCIIDSGNVSVFKANSDDKDIEITTLNKGRAFGEMAVLDGERRSAMCIAATDCTLLTLSKDALDKMLVESPRTAAKVIRSVAVSLSKRLRIADGNWSIIKSSASPPPPAVPYSRHCSNRPKQNISVYR